MRSLAALPLLAAIAAAQVLPRTPTRCYDYVGLDGHLQPAECMKPALQDRAISADGVAPTPTSVSTWPALSTVSSVPSAFDFSSFNCSAIGEREADFCDKVEDAFEQAGQILSGILALKSIIRVKVDIRPMCPNGACWCEAPDACDAPLRLGGARPARGFPLLDSDGQIRGYPQALVKQLDLPGLTYADYDILATFNGNTSLAHYILPGDAPQPIGSPGTAFDTIILHELMHGLGFLSQWQLSNISGMIVYSPVAQDGPGGEMEVFEAPFDRFITLQNGTTFGNIAKDVLSLVAKNDTAAIAAVGREMLEVATTNGSLTFKSVTGKNAVLETTLKPFRQGSSVSHLDYDMYANTSDFLMLQGAVPRSGSLAQQIAVRNELLFGDDLLNPGKLAQIDKRKALGPATRSILQSIGWTFRTNATDLPAPTSVAFTLDPASVSAIADSTAEAYRERRQMRWARRS